MHCHPNQWALLTTIPRSPTRMLPDPDGYEPLHDFCPPTNDNTELDLTSFHLWKSRYCHWNFLYFSCFHFKEKFNVNYTLYMNELSFYYFTNLHWINAFFLYFNILRPPHKIAITIKIGLVYNKIQKPAFSWQSSKHHFNRMMSIIFAEKNLIVWLIKIQIFNIFMNNL